MSNINSRLLRDVDEIVPVPQYLNIDSKLFEVHRGKHAPFYQLLDSHGNLIDLTHALPIQVSSPSEYTVINEREVLDGTGGNEDFIAIRTVSISNYGDGKLTVNFDRPVDAEGAITIRPLSFLELPISCSKLYWKAEEDTIFTAIGI